jgi:hypothetical protein
MEEEFTEGDEQLKEVLKKTTGHGISQTIFEQTPKRRANSKLAAAAASSG